MWSRYLAMIQYFIFNYFHNILMSFSVSFLSESNINIHWVLQNNHPQPGQGASSLKKVLKIYSFLFSFKVETSLALLSTKRQVKLMRIFFFTYTRVASIIRSAVRIKSALIMSILSNVIRSWATVRVFCVKYITNVNNNITIITITMTLMN